jgi:hypothetical protein
MAHDLEHDDREGFNGRVGSGGVYELYANRPPFSRQQTETPTVQELEARIEQSAIEDQAKIDKELEEMARTGIDPNDILMEDNFSEYNYSDRSVDDDPKTETNPAPTVAEGSAVVGSPEPAS